MLLARFLGVRRYLGLVSRVFLILMLSGFFRKKYPEYHFVRDHVKAGWYCIDIGANLGYFTTVISRSAGTSGLVIAVEPVKLFNEVLKSNVQSFGLKNVELYPYALGGEETEITMGTPVKEGVFRHGLTKVMESGEENLDETYRVEMKVPDDLFSDLPRLDFVKCDVEGYETAIFPHFLKVIEKHLPVLQIEISDQERRKNIWHLLKPYGYQAYGLVNNSLSLLSYDQMLSWTESDLYFVSSGS